MSTRQAGGLDAVDAAIYRAEKLAVASMLLLMGFIVAADVVHRSSAPGDLFGNPVAVGVGAVVLSVLAFRTRDDAAWLPKGVGLGLAVTVLHQGFLAAFPNGLLWSQTLALALTLWLGTMGASLASYERRHLAMDVGTKVWPASWQPKVVAVGHLVTALFALLLVYLGGRSVLSHWDLWSQTDGAAGNLSGLPIPKWFPSAAIPYGMGMVAFRFGRDAVKAWRGELALDEDETLHMLGIKDDAAGGGAA